MNNQFSVSQEQADQLTTALAAVAGYYCDAIREQEAAAAHFGHPDLPVPDDPVLEKMGLISSLIYRHPGYDAIAAALAADKSLEALHHLPGQLDPFVAMGGYGGFRADAANLLPQILIGAAVKMYFHGEAWDEATMQAIVRESVQDLRRVVNGGPVAGEQVIAFDGLSLPEGRTIDTPWGALRNAPSTPNLRIRFFSRFARVLLFVPIEISVKLDRAAEVPIPPANPNDSRRIVEAVTRLPLACCLALDQARRVAPLETWRTVLTPFTYSGYSQPYVFAPPRSHTVTLTPPECDEVEAWARSIQDHHAESIDVSAFRLVSAVGQRLAIADKLIDAVIVWENLFGTTPETSFRLCAAITKLLEPEVLKRLALMKQLQKVYGLRSTVAHGSTSEGADLQGAANEAIETAVRCLRAMYRDRVDLMPLRSKDRADTLLLS